MKFASLCNITKGKFLSKKSMKNFASKLDPGPFWFSKNPEPKGIWGGLHADLEKFG